MGMIAATALEPPLAAVLPHATRAALAGPGLTGIGRRTSARAARMRQGPAVEHHRTASPQPPPAPQAAAGQHQQQPQRQQQRDPEPFDG